MRDWPCSQPQSRKRRKHIFLQYLLDKAGQKKLTVCHGVIHSSNS
uniref:Uncharacterized protein n=1 Tax=Anguilla anguilla TaxID=7936 RepID=A0A0E9RNB6_ANGAN